MSPAQARVQDGCPQNLAHYVALVDHALEFSEQNEDRRRVDYFIRPLDVHIVNPLTDLVTDNMALPMLQVAYWILVESTICLADRWVSREAANRIEGARYDPLSTESLRRLGGRVEQPLSHWSQSVPVQIWVIGYLHVCSIVAARHMFIFVRDMNRVLEIPGHLRRGVNLVYEAADEEIIQPLARDLKEEMCRRVDGVRPEDPKTESWSSYLTRRVTKLAIGIGSGVGRGLAKRALDRVRDEASRLIDERERDARRQVVAIAAHSVSRTILATCIRGTIRAGAVVVCNEVMKRTIEALLPEGEEYETIAQTTSLAISATGALLWLRCLAPVVNQVHASYREAFNPKASTFSEVFSLLDRASVDEVAHTVCTRLEDEILEGKPYLQNFMKRVTEIEEGAPFSKEI